MIFNKLQQLSARDKRTLILGGIMLIIILCYLVIIAPINHYKQSLLTEKQDQAHLLALLKQAKVEVKTLAHRHVNLSMQQASLSSRVQQSLQVEKINPDKLETTNDKVTIVFNNVSFDRLMAWLIALHSQYALKVTDAVITKKPASGMVSANVVVQKQQ